MDYSFWVSTIFSIGFFALAQWLSLYVFAGHFQSPLTLYWVVFGSALTSTTVFYALIRTSTKFLFRLLGGRQTYDYQETLDQSCASLSGEFSECDAAQRMLASIDEQVKVAAVAMFVASRNGFVLRGFRGVKSKFYDYQLAKDSLLVRWLTDNRRVLFRSELTQSYDEHLITRAEIADLRRLYQDVENLQVHVAIPIFIKDTLKGIMLVGKSLSKLRYSAQDVEFFARIGRQILFNQDHLSFSAKVDKVLHDMQVLKKTTALMNTTTDIDVVLNMLTKSMVQAVAFSRAILLVYDDQGLKARALYGLSLAYHGIRVPVAMHRLERAFKGRELLVIEKKHRKLLTFFTDIDLQDGVIIPLRQRGQLVGIMVLDDHPQRVVLSASQEDLLIVMARQLEAALVRSSLSIERDLRNEQMFVFQQEADNLRSYTEHILYNISNAIVVTDPHDTITVFNKAAQDFFCCEPEKVLGKPISVLITQDAVGQYGLDFSRQEPFAFDGVINTAVGQLPIKGNFILLRSQGRLRGKLLVLSDISQIKALEKQLYFSDRLSSVGTMAASMIHEIKNPLTSLKMFSQVMSQRYTDPAFWDNYGVIVAEEIERLDLLVNNFLGFSRKDLEQNPFVTAEELIGKVIKLLAPKLNRNHIHVTAQIASDLVIQGDEKALQQVIINMLINAEQAFDPEQPEKLLSIRAYALDQKACICITDNGRGISDHERDEIFKPFYTTKKEGTGLGLFISSKIISDMSGRMSVKSKLGFGTEFRIELPLYHPQTVSAGYSAS